MIRNRTLFALMLVPLSLFGCATVHPTKQIAPDTYKYSVLNKAIVVSPNDAVLQAQPWFNPQEQCPTGYAITSQNSAPKPEGILYTWIIKCTKGE